MTIQAAGERSTVQVGLIATPALGEAIDAFADEFAGVLAESFRGVDWHVHAVRHGLLPPPAAMADLVDAARRHLLDQDWDLAVAVTEMPLRLGRRPLVKHTSPTHRVGLVSLPALGAVRVRHRLLESVSAIVATLVMDDDEPDDTGRRLVELADDVDADVPRGPIFLAHVIGGNISLLLGMIRSNHPWRFATRLSRALSGAVAAGSFALVTSDVWRTGSQLATWRLAAVALAAVAVATLSLISIHNLWERNRDSRVREQVALFNVVTAITIAFGIATLYLALFALSLAGGALVIQPSVFKSALGYSPNLADYVRLAWFTASLATVGGALGGALETDETVREAAYAHRGEEELVPAMNESDR